MSEEPTREKIERHQRRSRLVWIAVAILLAASAAFTILALVVPGLKAPGDGQASDWPTEHWAVSTPGEQGMDTSKLEAMMA